MRAEGVAIEAIAASACVPKATARSALEALQRWGYVEIEGDDVRATPAGRLAKKIVEPLPQLVEERWAERFGDAAVGELRASLEALTNRFARALPPALPVTGYAMFARLIEIRTEDATAPRQDLITAMMRVLLQFTLDFEARSAISLPMGANVLRVLTREGVRLRDLPERTGLAKEAVAVATGFLERTGLAAVEDDPELARTKRVRLTEDGTRAQASFSQRYAAVEILWEQRYGENRVAGLRRAVATIARMRDGDGKPVIARGLEPPGDGWRAQKPYAAQLARFIADPMNALPQYPAISHRSGWPDGS